jgi:hypothetical protein
MVQSDHRASNAQNSKSRAPLLDVELEEEMAHVDQRARNKHESSLLRLVGSNEGILRRQNLPDAGALFHDVLEVASEQSIRTGWATPRKFAHSRNLSVKIDDHIFRSQPLNSAHLPRYVTSFECPSPHFYMFLHNRRAAIQNPAHRVDELGFRPIVLSVRGAVCSIPRIDEPIHHCIRRSQGLIVRGNSAGGCN